MPLIRDVPAVELSPYLLQHTGNPVDWYVWGDDAFDKARRENRPVFLSIGYSACHWCHVMAHESFEDQASADALNASFVSIKVDREERPDVDAVYMEAVQAITGSGGWPMSVFLTPDRRPFYGGTYFPPDDRAGMPSFRSVLSALSDVWTNRRDEVEEQADELSPRHRLPLGDPDPTGNDLGPRRQGTGSAHSGRRGAGPPFRPGRRRFREGPQIPATHSGRLGADLRPTPLGPLGPLGPARTTRTPRPRNRRPAPRPPTARRWP